MERLKKIILLISGPGVLLFEVVVVFIQVFTSTNTKPLIIGGLLVFFIIFIPFYSVEYFRQEFANDNKKRVQFKRKNKRTEWGGGNVHGTTSKSVERPGKIFNK